MKCFVPRAQFAHGRFYLWMIEPGDREATSLLTKIRSKEEAKCVLKSLQFARGVQHLLRIRCCRGLVWALQCSGSR